MEQKKGIDPKISAILDRSVEKWNKFIARGRTEDLAEVYAWARLQGISLLGLDFTDRILGGGIFTNSTIERTSFHRCNLRGADFSHCRIQKTSFRGALLFGVNFENAVIVKSDFRGAKLFACNFKNASMTAPLFHRAEFCGGTLQTLAYSDWWIWYSRVFLEYDRRSDKFLLWYRQLLDRMSFRKPA